MKIIVLIAFTVAIVSMVAAEPYGEDFISASTRIHDECQADPVTKVDKDTMWRFYNGEQVDEVQFAKHFLCMNIKLGIMNEQGDINKGTLTPSLQNNVKEKQMFDECSEKKGNTAEEVALAMAKCIRKYKLARKQEHAHYH